MRHEACIGRCRPLHQNASIGAVARTVPLSVTRNQRLSSCGFSPITAPSGTLTPGAMIASLTHAQMETCASGIRTVPCTAAFKNSRKVPPSRQSNEPLEVSTGR